MGKSAYHPKAPLSPVWAPKSTYSPKSGGLSAYCEVLPKVAAPATSFGWFWTPISLAGVSGCGGGARAIAVMRENIVKFNGVEMKYKSVNDCNISNKAHPITAAV